MRAPACLALAILALAGCTSARRQAAPGAGAPAPASAEAVPSYAGAVRPLLERYCYDCHGNGKHKGDVALDRYPDEAALVADRATWERVMHAVGTHEMPPAKKPQPSLDERDVIARFIDARVFACDCSRPDPGRVTIRRLNRAEYNNTLRDLLGVDIRPADEFPVDNSGFGFDNNGDALSVAPGLAERYLAAAGAALDAALYTPALAKPRVRRFAVDTLEIGYNAVAKGDGWVMLHSFEEDDVAAAFHVPFAADYKIRVRAFADQDKTAHPRYERADDHQPVLLSFMVDSDLAQVVSVAAPKHAPSVYEVRLRAPAGRHRFRAVVRRVKNGLSDVEAARWRSGQQQKGWVGVQWMELEGPLDAEGVIPATHRRIFFGAPEAGGEREAARAILERFARRAYRRPPAPDEIAALVDLAAAAWQRGESFEDGVRVALKAVLVSPRFLFRGEAPPPDAIASGAETYAIDDHALATRLSYFLWSSTPDAELFAAADAGTLRADLAKHVRRMLRDPKARALVDDFAGQWLQFRNMDGVAPDRDDFPLFDDLLRAAMRKETELFFEHVVRADRSVLDFLVADYSFVNGRLAAFYGLPEVKGEAFQRVSLRDLPRRGVLGQASVLTLTSNPTRTSPVKRGKWVLETLLDSPPPPAPPDVPELKERELTGTLRERMEQHRDNPVCSSCHARMDPIGFGLENYDGVGGWRDRENDAPIDASGAFHTGGTFSGPLDLVHLLANQKKAAFVRALAAKLLIYGLGRGLEYYDRCALDEIVRATAAGGHRFSSLILAVVESAPFQRARVSRRDDGGGLAAR